MFNQTVNAEDLGGAVNGGNYKQWVLRLEKQEAELERKNRSSPKLQQVKQVCLNERFHSVSVLDSLPKSVLRHYLGTDLRQSKKQMSRLFAQGNERWVDGCIRYENDPRAAKYLQFCVESDSTCILYHWTAGYGIVQRADIFLLDNKKEIKRILVAEPRFGRPSSIHSFAQFKTALLQNQLLVTGPDDKNIIGEPAHILVRP